jgi:hypothetical protein
MSNETIVTLTNLIINLSITKYFLYEQKPITYYMKYRIVVINHINIYYPIYLYYVIKKYKKID